MVGIFRGILGRRYVRGGIDGTRRTNLDRSFWLSSQRPDASRGALQAHQLQHPGTELDDHRSQGVHQTVGWGHEALPSHTDQGPVNEFMSTMGFFSASLGFSCENCHGADTGWENYAADN